jgi:hypothetical protein
VGVLGPLNHTGGRDTFESAWTALPEALADEVDSMVARFLSVYADPVEYLPWDDGDYVWLVSDWATEEAVVDLFGELEASIFERICSYLEGIYPVWVRIADQMLTLSDMAAWLCLQETDSLPWESRG